MMEAPEEFKTKLPPLTLGAIILLILVVGSLSWLLRGIYEEFRHDQSQINRLDTEIERVNAYHYDRVDKKFERAVLRYESSNEVILDEILELEERIIKLEAKL